MSDRPRCVLITSTKPHTAPRPRRAGSHFAVPEPTRARPVGKQRPRTARTGITGLARVLGPRAVGKGPQDAEVSPSTANAFPLLDMQRRVAIEPYVWWPTRSHVGDDKVPPRSPSQGRILSLLDSAPDTVASCKAAYRLSAGQS